MTPDPAAVHEQIAAQARRRPHAIAISAADRIWDYAELLAAAGDWQAALRDAGVCPGDTVGLFADRTFAMTAAVTGILSAGAAYLPLDPGYPADRLRHMVADSGTRVVATEPGLVDRSPGGPGVRSVVAGVGGAPSGSTRAHRTLGPLPAQAPAYVLYTSGSTGAPKGTVVSHASLRNLFADLTPRFGLAEQDIVLAQTPLSFDISLVEVLLPLTIGAGIRLVDRATATDGSVLAAQIERSGATFVQGTPTTFRMLLAAGWRPDSRHKLLAGGEALPADIAATLCAAGAQLWNGYGPTEAAVYATIARIEPGDPITIGHPVTGVDAYVLDENTEPVADGETGELCVGGEGVAHGYHQRPALTAEGFVPDPFTPRRGRRMYLTGDLVRRLPDGRLEFLGRGDHQIKLRGYRIEPGEVEVGLRSHPAIADAVVTLTSGDDDRDPILQAHVVLAGAEVGDGEPADPSPDIDCDLGRDGLRDHLRRTLPAHMIPARFAVVDGLPLTPSGKVDRRAVARLPGRPLPLDARTTRPVGSTELSKAGDTPDRDPARAMLAHALTGLWTDLLGVDHLGPDESVFDNGADSLMAMRAVRILRDSFDVPVTVHDLFERRTVAAQADMLRRLPRRPDHPDDHVGASTEYASGRASVESAVAPSQEQMWWYDQLHPGTVANTVAVGATIDGPLDLGALGAALDAVVARHQPLRTRFADRAGDPMPVTMDASGWPLDHRDLRGRADQDAELDRLIADLLSRPLDPDDGPMVGGLVATLDDRRHRLVLTMHHLATDGYSLRVIERELLAGYTALAADGRADAPDVADPPSPPALPALPRTFAEVAAERRRRSIGPTAAADLAYWRSTLADPPDPPELFGPTPPARDGGAGFSDATDVVGLTIGADVAAAVDDLATAEHASGFTVLLAAFAVMLHKYTGGRDMVVCTPLAGRDLPGTDDLVGYLADMAALRLRLPGDPTFRQVIASVRDTCLDAFEHADAPFADVVRALAPERHRGEHPLFQLVFAAPPEQVDPQVAAGARFAFTELVPPAGKFDLEVQLPARSGAMAGQQGFVKFRTSEYTAGQVADLVDRYLRLVADLTATPERRLSAVSLVTSAERERAVHTWNHARNDGRDDPGYPRDLSCVDLFRTQVDATPHAPALHTGPGDRWLTYRQLDERTDRLAHYLLRHGAGPESRIGVCLGRGPDWVIAALAVVKTGAAYLPLDPGYPAERIAMMVADAGARLIVAGGDTVDRAASWVGDHRLTPRVVDLDADAAAIAAEPADPPAPRPGPDHLAYVMYTSGSTGLPKGVAVTHRNIVRLAHRPGYARIAAGDTVAQASTISFDAATFELWGALLNGARLVPLDRDDSLDPLRLADKITEHGIDVLFLTTSLAMQIAARHPQVIRPLRELVFGGEQPSLTGVRALLAAGAPEHLVNGYGPTETTTFAATRDCDDMSDLTEPNARIPIGRPIPGTTLYVLDADLEPVPPGVVGELCIGGDGVARGYLNRPDLTAERFVPDHLSGPPGARMYRTGDLARYRPDGQIEYLGRADRQVKIRGFRIEPGEIEACMERSSLVDAASVQLWRVGGEIRLAGYYVPAIADTGPEKLEAHLRAELPEHMVPAVLIALPAMPLTENGKLDIRALPDPADHLRHGDAGAADADPTQRMVADVWRRVLGVDRVDRADDFFALGGHSLAVARVRTELLDKHRVDVPLRLLFEHQTLAAFAAAVDRLPCAAEPAPESLNAPHPAGTAGDPLALLDLIDGGE